MCEHKQLSASLHVAKHEVEHDGIVRGCKRASCLRRQSGCSRELLESLSIIAVPSSI